ncbi:hypothetical protein [Halovivax limisalsi]|uniref:hypothetical protein n=1 Tax=Halovivax limisalsi TaxID=1453760 RepID=UPI001FFC90B8|nr:hypothetical protein [Halovivax limisalsi]
MYDHDADRSAPLVKAKIVTWGTDHELAKLRVTVDESTVDETDAAVVNAYNPHDESQNPRHTIPIHQGSNRPADHRGDGDRFTRETTIGTTPVTGRLRVEVQDGNGSTIAYEELSFDCS